MLLIVPLSLTDSLPTILKESIFQVENSSDIFLLLANLELDVKKEYSILIRSDLISLLLELLQRVPELKEMEVQIVEDPLHPLSGLDADVTWISLKDLIELVQERANQPKEGVSNVMTEITKRADSADDESVEVGTNESV